MKRGNVETTGGRVGGLDKIPVYVTGFADLVAGGLERVFVVATFTCVVGLIGTRTTRIWRIYTD